MSSSILQPTFGPAACSSNSMVSMESTPHSSPLQELMPQSAKAKDLTIYLKVSRNAIP